MMTPYSRNEEAEQVSGGNGGQRRRFASLWTPHHRRATLQTLGMKIQLRPPEQQFNINDAAKVRSFQGRLRSIRTTGRASDYFLFESINCLEAGLILAALQVSTSALELRARELWILVNVRAMDDKKGNAFQVEISIEQDRGLLFAGLVDALQLHSIISPIDCDRLKDIYKGIRIPMHHGIVRRYINNKEPNANSESLEILLRRVVAGFSTNQDEVESILEKHGIEDMGEIIAGLEILTSKSNQK